jgi:hypothetical protein
MQEITGEVRSVNAAGILVGFGREYDPMQPTQSQCVDQALFWPNTSASPETVINLGFYVPGQVENHAEAVNGSGNQVVGLRMAPNRALLWRNVSGWSYYDLNNHWTGPGNWTLEAATDINLFGLICGHGDNASFFSADVEGFVLIPDDCPCPGDADGDGDVDVQDLTTVIVDWNCGTPFGGPPPCPGDVSGDLQTNVVDLTTVVTNWGVCCNILNPPASLHEELAEGGLTMADWNEFLEHVDDANYRCWMAYHLGGGLPNCPGPDPWAP